MKALFEFNRVTFGLPVETFRVEANIALEKRLPVVTEFVLRLLRVCGPVSLTAFRGFFGFSDGEVLSVVESLSSEGLVEVVEDEVRLTSFAASKFDVAGGEVPRFSKVELRNDTVTFDLIHFFPLKSAPPETYVDNLLKLEAPNAAIAESIKRARQAYRDRFPEIASARSDLRERSYGVYSVEDVESKRRSYAPVPVNFSLDVEGQVKRAIDESFEKLAPPELVSFINEQITSEIPSTISIPDLAAYIDAFELPLLSQYMTGKKFELHRYIAEVHISKASEYSEGVEPIFGNLYLPENRDKIAARIESTRANKKGRRGKVLSSFAWLAPDYPLWGRGDDFSQAVSSFVGALQQEGSGDTLVMMASAESGQENQLANMLRVPKLKELHFSRPLPPEGALMGGRLEVMLYPTSFMVAMFHLPAPGEPGLWLPIGILSKQPKHLAVAQKLLRSAMAGPRYGGRAKFAKATTHGHQSFEEALPFLNYCPL